ncbi:zinc finger protein RFP-like isoform X2 [Dunckerocampus dactyliophorus]|uniref:zinc finger protein RFP-like isoform X2 n=1 Tax=Dunckerocampus dactyliophorus TaxID=161453 RepID=UPI0024074AFD|nr:zinc finger protein RFP-like isoform X2 [Dunckerocampus dactyliophorus]
MAKMASHCDTQTEKQLECPVCKQVLADPVTTPCGHNFCQACLQGVWDNSDMCRCPACNKAFAERPEICVNAAFKELADTFRRMTLLDHSSSLPLCAAKDTDVTCDVCSVASLRVSALKSCLVCLTSYCHIHLEPHRRVASLRMHRLMEPATDLRERLCSKHDKLLEMFCRDEQQCVCQFCTESEHKGHQIIQIEEEAEERKMKKTEADFEQMIQERQNKVEEIQNGLKLSTMSADEEKTKNERLFTFLIDLAEERRAEVAAEIGERERAAKLRADSLMGELRQEIAKLQERNAELTKLRDTEDHLHLLQVGMRCQDIVTCSVTSDLPVNVGQRFPLLTSPPPTREWAEISVNPEICVGTARRALSQLEAALKSELESVKTEDIKRMQNYAVNVELDPDTAHPNISLSADGKQVGRAEILHAVADNPQRFDPVICVLGKRGFLSGRFYFQVDVGTKTFWDMGVVKESVNRKGQITSKPENGFWTVRLRGGDEYRALDSPSVLLNLNVKPRTIGVFTDYEEGTVSFFDVDTRSHIYTFTGCVFLERVFPFFSPGSCDEGRNTAPLIITTVSHQTEAP